MTGLRFVVLAFLCAGVASAKITPEQMKALPVAAAHPVDFTKEIKPILEASCIKCHARGRAKGGLRLDTRETLLKGGDSGPAVVPGKSAESYLIELVAAVDPDNVMPQKGKRLTAEQVGVLRAWIDQGAKWDASVSFAKPAPKNLTPRQPEVPAVDANPIDALLSTYFAGHQITKAPVVDDRIYARRVYLDVVGLLPTPAEMREFTSDRDVNKRRKLVQKLLADDQRYAEHWLSFWNDALRNDYRGTGYIDGGRKQISSWLFNALVENMRYDRFVAALVNPTPESEGFAKGIVWRGVVNASQTPEMQAAQNISQVFMGVNLKCASCHDSFINDWTLADSYGLANIYSSEPLEISQCDKPTGKKAATKFIYPELGDIDAKAPKSERLKALAALMTDRKNGRLSRTIVNRLWARFMGRGLVEPLDDMEQAAWNSDLLDWLAEDLVAHGYNLKHTMERILTSEAYQLPAVRMAEQDSKQFVFKGPVVRRMSAEQFRDALGELTGVYYAKPAGDFDLGAISNPQLRPEVFMRGKWIWDSATAAQKAPPGFVYFRKRFSLAQQPKEAMMVLSCDNSFVAYLNGAKVGSGVDFARPAMIDLLPHIKTGENILAIEGANHTPDNKSPIPGKPAPTSAANPAGLYVQVQIVHGGEITTITSDRSWSCSTNKSDGWKTAKFAAADWSNVSELGPASMAPWNFADNVKHVLGALALKDKVRAAYVAADPLMVALGRPNREQVITSRATAATTLQALELTNGETLSKVLKNGAKRLAEKVAAPDGLINDLFQKALGRPPQAREKELSMQLLGSPVKPEGVEDLLWSLAMLPEFQLIY